MDAKIKLKTKREGRIKATNYAVSAMKPLNIIAAASFKEKKRQHGYGKTS